MSLADVSQVFNTIQQGKDNAARAAALKQQQQQFDRSQDLQEKQLDLQHAHEQAILAASQAYQRTQQFNELAANPQVARAQGQVTDQQYAQPMTQGPTNDLAAQPPVSQTLSVPSQVPGEQPFTLNLPTREEEARQQGVEQGLKNEPLYEQQKEIERQKEEGEANAGQMRALIDQQHQDQRDMYDRKSREDIAKLESDSREREGAARNATDLARERLQIQGLYDPNRVKQTAIDLYNGDTTTEDFNKSPLSKYEKEGAQSSLMGAGAHPINKAQSDYLNNVSILKDILPTVKSFIVNQPDMSNTFMAHARGGRQVTPYIGNADQIKRNNEIQSQFGEFAHTIGAMSSTGRIPLLEAQKIMGYLPDPNLPQQTNVDRYNDLIKLLGGHINATLSNIPDAQRVNIINKKVGLDLGQHFVDATHMKNGQSNIGASSGTGPVKVADKAAYDKLKSGTTYQDSKGNIGTKP